MRMRMWLAAGLALGSAGCATTGATLGSGVGDARLDGPPYYAGRQLPVAEQSAPLGHFPIAYQRGATNPESFEPAAGGAMAELLRQMNAYLDSLGVSTRLVAGAAAAPKGAVAPDVRFGCDGEMGVPGADCIERDENSAMGRGRVEMVLTVGRPSAAWTAWSAQQMGAAGVERALVITLEVADYWTRQRGLRGTKEVELGTRHVEELPWLTSLETPVSVLQLTGALVGADGKAIRIGAEGLIARRTRLLVSAIGAQELIGDEEVAQLLTARREDVAGKPLVWREALRVLVGELTGRTSFPF